jgi:glycosyltransferase involved in cell wall biosynthesis
VEPTASVVIITKDRLPLLRRVVRAASDDPATAEVVVVDDGSRDGTAGWLRGLDGGGPPLRVLRSEGVGPGAARQAGIERASGDVVVLLDDDVVPRPGLVSGHLQALRDDRACIMLGYMPICLPARRRAGDVALFAYARDYERRCARYEQLEAPVLHNLWGGNFALWREAAVEVGMVSPAFDRAQTFYEDRDFGLRALRAGLHGRFDRTLLADHLHRRTGAEALADSTRRGQSAVWLHSLHRDLIGPYDPRAPGLPLLPALAGIAATGRLGRWAAQDAIFKLGRRGAERRGALETRS